MYLLVKLLVITLSVNFLFLETSALRRKERTKRIDSSSSHHSHKPHHHHHSLRKHQARSKWPNLEEDYDLEELVGGTQAEQLDNEFFQGLPKEDQDEIQLYLSTRTKTSKPLVTPPVAPEPITLEDNPPNQDPVEQKNEDSAVPTIPKGRVASSEIYDYYDSQEYTDSEEDYYTDDYMY